MGYCTPPHDYYHGHGSHPHLRGFGSSGHYIEHDYIGSGADDQLPTISTIGRGPQGPGLSVSSVTESDGLFTFELSSTQTGEAVMQSPNLSAGYIYVTQPGHLPVPGETAYMDFHVVRGSDHQTYSVKLPSGPQGSKVFVTAAVRELSDDRVYTVPMHEIAWGTASEHSEVRVNDVLVLSVFDTETGAHGLAIASVTSVAGTDITAVSNDPFLAVLPYIDPDTGNWVVGEVDTGVPARGDDGETPRIGDNGNWVIGDDDTGLPSRGPKGEDGESLRIIGSYDSEADLVSAHPTGEIGDSYLVSGDLFIWESEKGEWNNVGRIEGQKGDKGDPGASGVPDGGTDGQLISKSGSGTAWIDYPTRAALGAAPIDHDHAVSDIKREGEAPLVRTIHNGSRLVVNIPENPESGCLAVTEDMGPMSDWITDSFSTWDFVEEKGTSGPWTYIKYKDGTAILYGVASSTYSSWGQWGTMYETDVGVGNLAYPFTFTSVLFELGQVRLNNGACWTECDKLIKDGSQLSQSGMYFPVRPNSITPTGGDYGLHVNLVVVGRWK